MARFADHTNFSPYPPFVFSDAAAAITAIRTYTNQVRVSAQKQLRLGNRQRDQDSRVETFALRPAHITSRPLVLLGGMGPLAGADGFERACHRFLSSREIVLLQACSIPDRTRAIKRLVRNPSSPVFDLMTNRLGSAVRHAVAQVTSDSDAIDLIVLCNTSHFFLPKALERCAKHYPDIFTRIRFVSLVMSTVKAISLRGYKEIMALYTEGTRLCGIYAGAFQAESLSSFEAKDHLKHLEPFLMRSIYGVKYFDEAAILEGGTSLFSGLCKVERKFDCILAGCTEIPLIIHYLKAKGNVTVKSFLRRTQFIDPVAEALALL
jgi:aspartate racemase